MHRFFFRSNFRMILILFLGVFISGCDCEEPTIKNKVLVFLDYTDKKILGKVKNDIKKDLKKIKNVFFPCLECTSGYFKVVQIRDNCQNKALLIQSYETLPSGISSAEPPPPDFGQFNIELNRLSDTLARDSIKTSLGETCLYEPICKEISNVFAEGKNIANGRRIILIYSDMLENDNGISLYNQPNIDAATFEDKLLNKYSEKLPDLNDIEIYIINHRDNSNDNLVRHACQIWKELFEKHGAKVFGPMSDFEIKNTPN